VSDSAFECHAFTTTAGPGCLGLVVADAALPTPPLRLLPADVQLLSIGITPQADGVQVRGTLLPLEAMRWAGVAAPPGRTRLHALLSPVGALALMHTGLMPPEAWPPALAQWPLDAAAVPRLARALHEVAGGPDAAVPALAARTACAVLARWIAAEWQHGRVLVPERVVEVVHALTDPAFAELGLVCRRLGVSRRSLQRETRTWFGLSPKALQSCARLQRAARLGWLGWPARDIAYELRLFDQSHLWRSVRRLTGLPLELFLRSASDALARALRAASGGHHVLTAARPDQAFSA